MFNESNSPRFPSARGHAHTHKCTFIHTHTHTYTHTLLLALQASISLSLTWSHQLLTPTEVNMVYPSVFAVTAELTGRETLLGLTRLLQSRGSKRKYWEETTKSKTMWIVGMGQDNLAEVLHRKYLFYICFFSFSNIFYSILKEWESQSNYLWYYHNMWPTLITEPQFSNSGISSDSKTIIFTTSRCLCNRRQKINIKKPKCRIYAFSNCIMAPISWK